MKQIIKNFKPQGGKHCITNALKQIFSYYGYPLSEEMLFGIGEGLDFTYIGLANAPMISGRSKTIEFEKTLSARLGIKIRMKQNKDYSKVFDITRKMIDNHQPVMVYVDMPFLDYLGLDKNSHFGGHAIVLFGYDDKQKCFYVSERDHSDHPIRTPNGSIHEDYHLVDYAQMQLARSSSFRPFPANNKYAEFDFSGYSGISKDVLAPSIAGVCNKMLNPPANLKGVKGIRKFSDEIRKWKKFDTEKLIRTGVTNYFQINADGGTGGGIFRKMYGSFLIEASEILKNNQICRIGEKLILLSSDWDHIGDAMWALSETCNQELLHTMSCDIFKLYQEEMSLLTKLKDDISEAI